MFLFFLLAVTRSESYFENEGIEYILNDDNMTAIINGTTKKEFDDLVINSTVEYSGNNYTVYNIGNSAFSGTIINGKLTLPSSLIYIGELAFRQSLRGLEHLCIPDSVITIGRSAFYNTSIVSVTFGKKVEVISRWSFAYCLFLNKEIELPSSLRSIERYAFFRSAVTVFKGGVNVLSYGEYAFAYSDITAFELSRDLTRIPEGLYGYSKLSGVFNLPSSIVSIGAYSFAYTRITEINIPQELDEVSECAFFYCVDLSINIVLIARIIGNYAFAFSGIKSISGLTCNIMGDGGFQGCAKLTGLVHIRIINSTGEKVFYGCSSLKSLLYHGNYLSYGFAGGCSSLELSYIWSLGEDFEIQDEAFAMCTSLSLIKYPNSIKRIGSQSFFSCKSLVGTLDLTKFTNLTEIGSEAFLGCHSLAGELSFPTSLITIGDSAFIECKFYGSLHIPNSVKSIGKFAFFGCMNFNGKIYIGNGCESIGESAFAQCKGFKGNVYIGSNVKIIGASAFFGCESLTGNLEIPGNVTVIGDSAFANCLMLSGSLILNEGLVEIGENAFAECHGLSGTLTLPNSLTKIGSMAFFKCIGFKDVYFLSNEVDVGFMAFSRMHNKCFSNVPDGFADKDAKKYDSDNFKGSVIPESYLNMHCSAFYGIDTFLIIFTSIISTGAFAAISAFVLKLWSNRKTNIGTLTLVFKEIIANCKGENTENAKEITVNIISKINERLMSESEDPEFTTTLSQAKEALNKALEEEWPTLLPVLKRNVVQNSFDGIEFHSSFEFCFFKKEKDKANDEMDTDVKKAVSV
jgi:hypothetical protein